MVSWCLADLSWAWQEGPGFVPYVPHPPSMTREQSCSEAISRGTRASPNEQVVFKPSVTSQPLPDILLAETHPKADPKVGGQAIQLASRWEEMKSHSKAWEFQERRTRATEVVCERGRPLRMGESRCRSRAEAVGQLRSPLMLRV